MDERPSTWERREHTGHHYTYIRDPDGNVIELLYHPLGLEDSAGKQVDMIHDPDGLTWTKRQEYETSR